MISQGTGLPVDISAVKEYGIDKWKNEFSWPVSYVEFVNLCRDIEQTLIKHINTQPEEISDLLLIIFSLRTKYYNYLHALKVRDKMDVLYTDKSLWYGGVLGLKERTKRNIKNDIKSILKCRLYNMAHYRPKEETLVIYSRVSRLMESYIGQKSSRLTSKIDWMANTYKTPQILAKKIKEVSRAITNNEYLQKFTEATLLEADNILHNLKVKERTHLLISNLGNIFSCALCLRVRKAGGRVTSFTHGGNVGVHNSPYFSFLDFSFADEFITYTQKSIDLFERIKSNHPPFRNNKANISSCQSDEFFNIWKRHGNKPLSKEIKRVMIVGYPHNQWRKPQAAGGFSLVHLDLELRIVDVLKKAGYQVLYKAHPDRIREIKGVFDDETEVLEGYFQNYLEVTDTFLFGSTRTTAFPIALCTNKPIIAFELDNETFKPFSEVMEILKKRCTFIHAQLDEKNRIIFDKKELLDALAKEPKHPNNEFIKTYMFPERAKV